MPTAFLIRLQKLPTFWQIIFGSVALHALVLAWMAWQTPRALPKPPPPLTEVELISPPVEAEAAPPKKLIPAAQAKAKIKVKARAVVKTKPRRAAKPRPKTKPRPVPKPRRAPVVAPKPRPIPVETTPPPRERETPVIAPQQPVPRTSPAPHAVVPNLTNNAPTAPTIAPAPTLDRPKPIVPANSSTGTNSGPTNGGDSTGGGANGGGSTAGGVTADSGSTGGNATAGGTTAGDATSGGMTAGGVTSGGVTAGGITAGGVTSGGSTAGGITAGGVTSGGNSTGGPKGGGPYGLPGGGQGARRIVYILDVSPSMETRIGRAEGELRAALDKLVAGESFNIVAFDAKTYAFEKLLVPATPANLARARKFLEDVRLDVQEQRSNGTNLQLALRKALQTKGVNRVVVITDGEPTVGEKDYATIAAKARALNKTGAIIDTVGLIGLHPDGTPENFQAQPLLRQIARESGGESRFVQDENATTP